MENNGNDLKRVTDIAKSYIHNIMGDLNNFSVDELRQSKDDKYWLVTLGWDVLKNTPPAVSPAQRAMELYTGRQYYEREERVIILSKEDYNVKMMVTKNSDEFHELSPELD